MRVGSRLTMARLHCMGIRNARSRDRMVRFNSAHSLAHRLASIYASAIGCSLINSITENTGLAHGAIIKVLRNVGPRGLCLFEGGPRRFVHGAIDVVGRRGSAVVIRSVGCGVASNGCSDSVFAIGDEVSFSHTCSTGGRVASCMFDSDGKRQRFTRSLSRTDRIIICTGLPHAFRVPAPINGCTPS